MNAKVHALVRFPDNSKVMFYLNPIAEGIHEVEFKANLFGTYIIRIAAEGHSLRGAPFTREAVRTAIVWPGGDREPPSGDGDYWCRLIRCLLESKAIDPEVLKRLGVNVEGTHSLLPTRGAGGKDQAARLAWRSGRNNFAPGREKGTQKRLTQRAAELNLITAAEMIVSLSGTHCAVLAGAVGRWHRSDASWYGRDAARFMGGARLPAAVSQPSLQRAAARRNRIGADHLC